MRLIRRCGRRRPPGPAATRASAPAGLARSAGATVAIALAVTLPAWGCAPGEADGDGRVPVTARPASGSPPDTGAGEPATASSVSGGDPGPARSAPARDSLPEAPPPLAVAIPAIGVESPLIRLGLAPDGALEVPRGDEFDLVGWYEGGPTPGSRGPAVLAGHVDSRRGPSVFLRLGSLRPGDEIAVTAVDGTVSEFTVERTESYRKDEFPTEAVYGATPGAELRLITCGGEFDRSARSYRDNVVVYATRATPGS